MNNYTSDFNPKQHKRFVLFKRCKNINFENNLDISLNIKSEKPPNINDYHNFPVGFILPYRSKYPPDGWLLCNGQDISQNTYPHLFSIIGNYFNKDTPHGKFKLPDLRGKIIDNNNGFKFSNNNINLILSAKNITINEKNNIKKIHFEINHIIKHSV
jgi:hypothetical protein